jgi:hypothetical protein
MHVNIYITCQPEKPYIHMCTLSSVPCLSEYYASHKYTSVFIYFGSEDVMRLRLVQQVTFSMISVFPFA